MGLALQWCHYKCVRVSNHQPHHFLLICLLKAQIKKTSKLRITGLCAGNSPGTGEFPAQRASNAENVFIWWRHHETNCSWNIPVPAQDVLTYSGPVSISPDTVLSPSLCRAITRPNGDLSLRRHLETYFNEIRIKIQPFSFKKTQLKMSYARRRPRCHGVNFDL